jgi:hypothetical protein
MEPILEDFAKRLVERVRDLAIKNSDRRLLPGMAGVIGERWQRSAAAGDCHAFAHEIIPDVVDDTLFFLLLAIDEGQLNLLLRSQGRIVDLQEQGLGELAGWYMGQGWRDVYSSERFTDVMR